MCQEAAHRLNGLEPRVSRLAEDVTVAIAKSETAADRADQVRRQGGNRGLPCHFNLRI